MAFFDGQNLYHAAKDVFGYNWPNYDPMALAAKVCERMGWKLAKVHFYTGIPSKNDNPFWKRFWDEKLLSLIRRGAYVYKRELRYREKEIDIGNGGSLKRIVAEEKGIDVRIALDVLRLAFHRAYDVAIIFSQDQDLSEVASEIKKLSKETSRWIKVASAFPTARRAPNVRGINETDWIGIDRDTYDACLDPRDYKAVLPPARQ